MENVVFPFIAITPRSTLTQTGSSICLFSNNVSDRNVWKSLVLDENTWYHIIVYKFFVSRIVIWSYRYLLRIIIS